MWKCYWFGTSIWSNFMRMHIDKELCHFFMVNLSSLLTLIFIEIACFFFLLLKFKLLIDNWIKNRPEGFFYHELWPKGKTLFWLFGTPLGLFLIQLSIKNLKVNRRKRPHAILINIKVRRELRLTMKKWHSFLSICILMKFDHMFCYYSAYIFRIQRVTPLVLKEIASHKNN